MKKIIIFGFCFLFSVLVRAEVQVQVDSTQINFDEPFRLTLTQSNIQNTSGIPDLTPLRKDFVIIGTERSVNYSIINGQTQSTSSWTITLKAQKAGTLTIPAIHVGSEATAPIILNVETNAPQPNVQNTPDQLEDVILTTEVNEKKPYVNQQIIYKVTLYNSKQLLDANYQPPKVDNALLIPLGGEKRYQTQRDGVQYLVEEQNYAVFPQKSGTLHITSPIFTALIYDFNPQRVKVEDKPIIIEVQPIPKHFMGKEWLPAKQVKLTEKYENIGSTISQGNTLVRTVTLESVGIPAQLLPTLNFAETDAFSVYPEKGNDKNQVKQGELISRIEIKVTYLFNKSGKVTIPELKLPWFNTVTGKEEIATLAPKTLEVTPSTTAPSTANINQQPLIKNQETTPLVQEPLEPDAPKTIEWAWIVAAFLGLAWLLTLILWGCQKRGRTNGKRAYKKALGDLHKACNQGNPQRARDALLTWARLHWPDAPLLNLIDLTHLPIDASMKKQVNLLSQVLYKNVGKTLWRGDELWRSVLGMKKTNSEKKIKPDNLPPINPV